MPHTEVKKHWLFGPRLKTTYTDNDRMLLALGKKLGIKNILEVGPKVTKVLVDETTGEITELRFILDDQRGTPKWFGLVYTRSLTIKNNGLMDLEYSSNAGSTWGRVFTWQLPVDNTSILMKINKCME
jgi:hypothetical protein